MSTVTKEMIEHLQNLVAEGTSKLQQAAQYAGENNIPLKYIDDWCEEQDEDDEGEPDPDGDGYGPKLRFGGQGFTLEKGYQGHYRWNNSNCY